MNRARLLRITGCFLITFLLGGTAGWILKPAAPARFAFPAPIPPAQRVMENLDARLKLSAEQKTVLKPLLEEWGRQVEQFPRQPRRRRDVFEAYAPRIRAVLKPGQFEEFDKIVAEARARFERRLR
jgi:hypothetical protein